jgi:hypothetical protein
MLAAIHADIDEAERNIAISYMRDLLTIEAARQNIHGLIPDDACEILLKKLHDGGFNDADIARRARIRLRQLEKSSQSQLN